MQRRRRTRRLERMAQPGQAVDSSSSATAQYASFGKCVMSKTMRCILTMIGSTLIGFFLAVTFYTPTYEGYIMMPGVVVAVLAASVCSVAFLLSDEARPGKGDCTCTSRAFVVVRRFLCDGSHLPWFHVKTLPNRRGSQRRWAASVVFRRFWTGAAALCVGLCVSFACLSMRTFQRLNADEGFVFDPLKRDPAGHYSDLALPDNRLSALHDYSDLAAVQVGPEDMNHAPTNRLQARPGLRVCLQTNIIVPGLPDPGRRPRDGVCI